MKELKEVSDWESLGVYLGVSHATLETVKQESDKVNIRKYKMLAEWLKSTPKASWEDVVSALTIMDENCVAQVIKEKYKVED